MRKKLARLCAIAAFLLAGAGMLSAAAGTGSLRTGRVISATVSGHGPAEVANKKKASRTTNRTDIWWNYCVSTEGQSYSVLSRESPAKTGLTKNSLIRFSERKNRIYVVNPRGKRISLRILRKDRSGKCP
jgi:hypothetical protein